MAEEIKIAVTSLQSALDCPRCFWLRYNGLAPPALPLPGVLNRMDTVIKDYMERFVGRSDLPDWFPVRGEFLGPAGGLEETDPGSGVTVRGVPDALARASEGYYVVDYKTARPRAGVPDYYRTQLDGYSYLLEQNGREPVVGGFLLYFYPAGGALAEKRVPFEITPVRVEVDPGRIPAVLAEVRRILEMEAPPAASDDCEMCKWRKEVGKTLSK